MKDPLIMNLNRLRYQKRATQNKILVEGYAELVRLAMLAANPTPAKYYEQPQRSKKAPKQWRTK